MSNPTKDGYTLVTPPSPMASADKGDLFKGIRNPEKRAESVKANTITQGPRLKKAPGANQR